MGIEYITEGSIINTTEGYLEVKGHNDSDVIYFDEYGIDNELVEEYASLTLHDIARRMQELDGRHHEVCWIDRYTYAVQEESSDSWDECADSYEEAVELANDLGRDIIVKIDQLTHDAIQEWHRGEDF